MRLGFRSRFQSENAPGSGYSIVTRHFALHVDTIDCNKLDQTCDRASELSQVSETRASESNGARAVGQSQVKTRAKLAFDGNAVGRIDPRAVDIENSELSQSSESKL